jgi:hypothetical protein
MASRLLLFDPATDQKKVMTEKTFALSLHEFLAAFNYRGLRTPTFIYLSSKYEAINLILELKKEEEPLQNFKPDYDTVIQSIEAGISHGFMLAGVEFRWPFDPPVAPVAVLKAVA